MITSILGALFVGTLVVRNSGGTEVAVAERQLQTDITHIPSGAKEINITAVNFDIVLDDARQQDEFILTYTIETPLDAAKNDYTVRLYGLTTPEADDELAECDSDAPIPSTEVKVSDIDTDEAISGGGASDTGTGQQLPVQIDLIQDSIFNSGINSLFTWTDETDQDEAVVSFCTRLVIFYDYLTDVGSPFDMSGTPAGDMEAIVFHDSIITLSIDLTQGFQVTDIDLEINAAVRENAEFQLDYEIDAYQCNQIAGWNQEFISQTKNVFICVRTNTTDVAIRKVYEMTFLQQESGVQQQSIANGDPNSITTSTPHTTWNKIIITSTRLALPFFDNDAAGGGAQDTDVSGTVIMKFQDDSAITRRLSGMNARSRSLQQGVEEETGFNVQLGLVKEEEDSSASVKVFSSFVFVASFLFSFF